VDAFLTQEVDPAHSDSAAVGQDLAELLSAHRYDPEYSGKPLRKCVRLVERPIDVSRLHAGERR
jgi:hypothetical protein